MKDFSYSNLKWSKHVDNVVTKANRTLGFVRRNLKAAPKQVRSQAYLMLVHPNLEYCSSVWDPHYQGDSDRVEAVQRCAARFAFKRYHYTNSVTEMISELGWPTLKQRRHKARLSFMYKLSHNLLNLNPSDYLTPITRCTRSNPNYTYIRPRAPQDYYALSYFPRTIKDWNDLSGNIVNSPSIDSFTSNIQKLYKD